MAKSKMGIVINGIVKENPVFVLMLGLCPTLGTSSSAIMVCQWDLLQQQFYFSQTYLFLQ